MHLLFAFAFFFQAASADTATLHGARGPAFGPDGRLAVSVNGDIFAQQAPGGRWLHLTSGIAWDRDPVWTRDGAAIVFSSDRSGQYAIWRMKIAADGTSGTPERITNSNEPENAPTTAPDGSIAFARGEGNAARIWIHAVDGGEKRFDSRELTEIDPVFSPDGSRIAFIETNETGRRVLVRGVNDSRETVVNATSNAERLAWAPAGDRIAFTAGNRGGVYVAPLDGRWTNFVSAKHGDIAWSQDGKIAIVEHEDVTTAYNGDPDRLGERIASETFESKENLYYVTAPPPPDAGLAEQKIVAERDRAERYGDAYDRVWERSTKLYFSQPDAAGRLVQWQTAKAKHRPEALAAKNDDELQAAIYAMLRERPATRSSATGRAAVSSAHPIATAAGIEILKAGGNVVDAAVAVSFTLGVVEPDASGVGGYGQMVINLAKMEKPTLIEFMTRVPEDATLSNTSMLINGRYPPDGAALVNVPGTVAGMYRAYKDYGSGKVAWKDILAPAIRAATNGYVLSEGTATTFSTEREHFLKYDGSRALFFNKNGTPKVAGDTIKNPDLAWVLGKIAEGGADGFYKGEVAQKWVSDLRAHGNTMKLSDLARYFAPEREPVSGTYRGYTFYASSPPVSGGAEMAGKLNLLEHFEKPKLYTEDAATMHAIVSAWLLVPSTRNRIADPDLWPTDIAPIISKDTAALRWQCYDPNKALSPSQLRGDVLACAGRSKIDDRGSKMNPPQLTYVVNPRSSNLDLRSPIVDPPSCGPDHAAEVSYCHSSGTTAFTVADNEGNAVAVTQTLGTWGGDFYVSPGLGFLSNDKLTSYSTDSTQYGSRLAFARHGSTITPTIVFKGKKLVFAVGAAGNNWITSAVFETLLGALDYGMGPQQALELPRFIPGVAFGGGGGGRGGRGAAAAAPAKYNIEMEDGFSPEVIRKLRELGYDISYVSMRGELREGYGAAVAIDGKKVTAGADPRRAGTAGAIP
jgi:gamma-glutamyltranspeptidase